MSTGTKVQKFPALLALAVCLALPGTVHAQGFEVVHTFSGNQGRPLAALTEGADGRLYGTTISGGFFGKGSVYATDAAGNAQIVWEFGGFDGQAPRGRLLLGSDNALYGTTSEGGFANSGTVFRITEEGTFELLAEFDGSNGANPQRGLVQATNGDFYGTTLTGGAAGNGTIFRMTATGLLTTLVSFNDANGAFPAGSLIQAADGFLYGTTRRGGAAGLGTVFKVTADTGALTTVVTFDGSNGAMPNDGPMQASNGDFYGMTQRGGTGACAAPPESLDATGCGTIFRLSAGVLTTIHSFAITNGKLPVGALRELSDGQIYGTTPEGGLNNEGTLFRISTDGVFTSLMSFSGASGSFPASGVIQTTNGAIFGTTESGGAGTYGTVFELLPNGSIRNVLSFAGSAGAGPSSRLLQATDGNFYGTTVSGGKDGMGSVFRMTPAGIMTTLASFDGNNGMFPSGGLVQSIDGDLYGTTESGGPSLDGTLFRVTLNGDLESFPFNVAENGSFPSGRLIESRDGYIYGTTYFGKALFDGETFLGLGAGAVFRFDRGLNTIQAYQLDESTGFNPSAGVVEGPDGFYGTAELGGEFFGGTVFRMAQSGEFSTVVSFDGITASVPASPLIIASDGKLYGTTSGDFFNGGTTLFRVALDGTGLETVALDGAPYQQGVVEVSDGVFYGTTTNGGVNGWGNVYRWSELHGLESIHDFTDDVHGNLPNTTLMKSSDNRLYGTAAGPQGGVIYRIEVVTDTTAPVLQLPANLVVNATSPAGATVNYEATATDDSAQAVTLTCSPASGSVFAIGVTTVTCTATDAAGNIAQGSFTVKVLSAAEQLVNLLEKIRRMPLSPTVRTLLISTLNKALADPRKTQIVLDVLKLLEAAIRLRCRADVAASLITDIRRIRAVIGG